MTKRIDFIKMAKDVKIALQAPFRERKDKKNLEGWLIDREQKIAELEDKIQQVKGAENFDVECILDAMDDLQLEKRRLVQGQELLAELFD